jgi:cell division protein FtsB
MASGSKFLDPSSIPLRQQRNGNLWAQLLKVTQFLLLLAVLASLGALFLPIIQRSQALQEKKTTIERKIAQASYENRILQREFELLKTNPEYIERTARDTLHLGRPGEVIFRFGPYLRAEEQRASSNTP